MIEQSGGGRDPQRESIAGTGVEQGGSSDDRSRDAIVETPPEQPDTPRSPDPEDEEIRAYDPRIYRLVVSFLGVALILVVLGAFGVRVMGMLIKDASGDIPDSLVAIGSGALGALAGLLAPSAAGPAAERDERRPSSSRAGRRSRQARSRSM